MSNLVKEILFFIVVLLSNIIQCITGFAGTVLAMPFGLMLVGYSIAKPALNVLGIVASIGVVATNYKYINFKEFANIIVTMFIGMVGGMYLSKYCSLNGEFLYKLLGIIVLVLVLIGIYTNFIKPKLNKDKPVKQIKYVPMIILSCFILIIAGIVHGLFVCGGPLLVIYASEKLKDKNEFRSTLSAVWIVLNSIIMVSDIKAQYFNERLLVIVVICIAVLIVALFIGNKLAKKMDYKTFMIITYILMFISGVSILVK